MLFDFFRYINTPNDYLECYSTFLMTRKDLKSNILKHRMNVLINSYLNDKNTNKYDYYYYYLMNHKDDYLERPLITNQIIIKDEFEDFDRDIKDHYNFMLSKPPPEPIIDYDEIDKKFYEEEYLKQKEKEDKLIEMEYEDDEYYDEYEDYDECDDFDDPSYDYDDYY